MNDKFDELAKNMAQSVTRRGALKKFGVGIAGIALASLGLANKAVAGQPCTTDADCPNQKVCSSGVCSSSVKYHCRCGSPNYGCDGPSFYDCVFYCGGTSDPHGCGGGGA